MAGHSQQRARKAEAARAADFDDQLWPVNVAILLLAAFAAGIVVTTSDFRDPRVLYNGWVRLGSVALMVGILVWAVVWLQDKMRRRVQFCLVLSLLFHLWLGMYLHDQYLALRALEERTEAERLAERPERITVPDYHWDHLRQRPKTPQSFEKPVETLAPDGPEPEVTKEEQTEHQPPVEIPRPARRETPRPQQPEPAVLRRAELSAPRRAQEAAGPKISRREQELRLRPDGRLPQPVIKSEDRRAGSALQPVVTAPRRRQPQPAYQRQAPAQEPRARPLQEAVKLARRAGRSEPLPDVAEAAARPSQPVRQVAARERLGATGVAESTPLPAPWRERIAAPEVRTMPMARTSAVAVQVAVGQRAEPQRPAVVNMDQLPSAVARRTVASQPPGSQHAAAGPRTMARAAAGAELPSTAERVQLASPGEAGSRQTEQIDAVPSATAVVRSAIQAPRGRTAAAVGGAIAAPRAGDVTLPRAAARRATVADEHTGSGDFGRAGPTPLTKAKPGTYRPAGEVPLEDVSEADRGGLAVLPSGRPDRLEGGPEITVRRAASAVPWRRTIAAPGSAEVGLGSTTLIAAVGPARATGEVVPALLIDPDESPMGRRATSLGTVAQALAVEERASIPESVGGVERTGAGQFEVVAASDLGGPSRGEGGLPVRIAAAAGPGGLSNDPSPVLGIPSRRARPESEIVVPTSGRFVLRRSGGRLMPDSRVRLEPAEAFRQRALGRRAESARRYGGTAGTERAVELGLDFLARHQFPEGCWSLDRLPDAAGPEYRDASLGEMNSDTAATGLALLAFLGAGYTHLDDQYLTVVRRGLDWLVGNQQPNGQLFTWQTDQTRYAQSYAHGIGAIALSEAYGMTRDPGLREPAQRAIQYICAAQHPELGGWRYTPKEGDPVWRKESDTSVSGWQLMALKSAQMAGLEVPDDALEKVSGWLDSAEAADGSLYVYNPNAGDTPEQRKGRDPNRAMTAEGLLMRLYLGWGRDHPAMIEGAEYLKANLPEMGTERELLRDCYYWYYATQVMFQMQEDYWSAWNGRLRPLLVGGQVDSGPLAGSWHPRSPVRDRWAHAGGRLYVTAMNLLMLEVYYRHLPLFQTLAE